MPSTLHESYKRFLRNIRFYFSRQLCYPLAAPDVLQLSVTNQCNLRCKSCYVWRNACPESDLTLDEIEGILEESARWGIKEVHMLGGEPLLRKDWDKIVLSAKAKGMTVIICTNGTLIDPKAAERIIDTGVDTLCVSLDGAKKETHDYLRGHPGAYEKILEGINSFNHIGGRQRPGLVLILTVSQPNLFELKEYADLAKKMSASGIYFTALVLDNVCLFSQKKTHDLWIEEKYFGELEKIFGDLEKHSQSMGYYLGYPSFKLFSKYYRGKLRKNDWKCFAGTKRLVVTASGDIQICGEIIGSYRKAGSLRKVWRSRAAFRRRLFVKNCGNYCLQDCHARPESDSFLNIIKRGFK